MRAEGRPSILCYIVRSIAVPSSLSMPGSIDDVVSSNVCPFKFRIVFVAEQNSPVVVPNTHKHTQPMLLSARASSTVYNKANKKLAEKSIEKKSVIDADRPGELIVADDTKQAQASRITHNQVENWPIMSNCSARQHWRTHPFTVCHAQIPHTTPGCLTLSFIISTMVENCRGKNKRSNVPDDASSMSTSRLTCHLYKIDCRFIVCAVCWCWLSFAKCAWHSLFPHVVDVVVDTAFDRRLFASSSVRTKFGGQ